MSSACGSRAWIDRPETLRAKYQYFTRADIAKLRATGYAVAITLIAEAVADYVQSDLGNDPRLGDET